MAQTYNGRVRRFDVPVREMRHVMIDIETLAVSNDAAILSIGACTDTGMQFYTQVCPEFGERDLATYNWWMSQPGGEEFVESCIDSGIKLRSALYELNVFITGCYGADRSLMCWCRGNDFDFRILEYWYDYLMETSPWAYWEKSDYRTLLTCFPQLKRDPIKPHHALSDAMAQMDSLKLILERIKDANNG